MEQSVLQQAIERVIEELDRLNQRSAMYEIVSILESLLPAERAMLEKAMDDAWEATVKHHQLWDEPDKQTFIDNYLK